MYQKLNKAISFIHQTSPKSNFNTYVGKNNLFHHLSLEENMFHQSLIKDWKQFLAIFTKRSLRETAEINIYNFRSLRLGELPYSATPLVAFVDSILKDTDYLIYQPPSIIYEEEMNLTHELMRWASLKHNKNFIDIEKSLTISLLQSEINIIKKAA